MSVLIYDDPKATMIYTTPNLQEVGLKLDDLYLEDEWVYKEALPKKALKQKLGKSSTKKMDVS